MCAMCHCRVVTLRKTCTVSPGLSGAAVSLIPSATGQETLLVQGPAGRTVELRNYTSNQYFSSEMVGKGRGDSKSSHLEGNNWTSRVSEGRWMR
jgi:hypothetical protein